MKKIKDDKILLLVLFLMSFSIGIWSNYRQLWLKDMAGFSVNSISKLFSVALICSAIISFIISLFSSKIKIKLVILESIIIRTLAMGLLFFNISNFTIKVCMLLTIMCEVIFGVGYYPLLTFVDKSDEMFRKKSLAEFVAKDIGIISIGILLGISVNNVPLIDYNDSLLIALFANVLSGVFLLLFKIKEKISSKSSSLLKSFKNIFKDKVNNYYLTGLLFINISYGIVFDLMLIILTDYINFEVSFASIFIIVCNFLGSLSCSIFNKISDKISCNKGIFIKFGLRFLAYIVAFIVGNINVFIASIVVAFITSRILEDKTAGVFLKRVNNSDQFLYGNIRYFVACIGEGIGAFLAGVFLGISFNYLFLGAGIITLIQIIFLLIASKYNSV